MERSHSGVGGGDGSGNRHEEPAQGRGPRSGRGRAGRRRTGGDERGAGRRGPVTGTSPLAPPLGACLGSQCPGTWPPPYNGDFAGRDAAINIFAGADFSVTGRAAEAEGKIVVLRDFREDKNGGGIFNAGVVGVGSRVPPPDGADFLTVGRNVDIVDGNRLQVGGNDSKTTAYGNLRFAGTLSGQVEVVPAGESIHDADATGQYSSLRGYIEDRSECAATATATGSVTVDGPQVTFTGDGTSLLQVFDVPGDIGGDRAADMVFTGIPAGATVLVNMTGTTPTVNTNTGSGLAGDPTTDLRPRLMWNFPNATTAEIKGGAQFQGSILGGNPSGTVTISAPGQNGRVYVAGNLVLTNSSAGAEIHAYPFDGVLPECGSSPNSSSSTSTTPSTEPTTTAPTSTEPTTTAPTTTEPTTTTSTSEPSSPSSPSSSSSSPPRRARAAAPQAAPLRRPRPCRRRPARAGRRGVPPSRPPPPGASTAWRRPGPGSRRSSGWPPRRCPSGPVLWRSPPARRASTSSHGRW
ncbi:choice-of-anchor A domain-containing protein [Catenulispora sp. MAP5-51]|uniref:choice-of-anchor A family protein n=1 Tax=Catenulispora sp. MAP5-51 TaxID=3156298 RepID=UPI00351670DE